ncbi:MAG: EAL domain-containing protein [Wolinella sp.]
MYSEKLEQEFLKTITILFVEDEDDIREAYASLLKRRFKKVYLARDGKEGLDLFQRYQPDIVITDIMMPQVNGLAMSASIKQISPETPIIIVTAYDDSSLLVEAISIGIDGYVLKPVNDVSLSQAIRKSLGGLRYQQERKEAQRKDALISMVSDNSPTGICLFGENGIIYVNKAMEEITGYSTDEMIGKTLFDVLNISHDGQSSENLSHLKKHFEVQIKTKTSRTRHVDITTNSMELHGSCISIANIVDVTDKKWFKEELEHSRARLEELNHELKRNMQVIQQKNRLLEEQLYTDKLTSLPNRYRLLEDLKQAKNPFLMLLNIDSFKEVNDFYGTEIGDFVLKEVAKRLISLINHGRFKLYKLQADEYALLDSSYSPDEDLEALGRQVHDEVDSHLISLKEQEIHIRISAGLAYGDNSTVMSHADIALKLAKKQNRPFVIYNSTMMVMKEYAENFRWIRMLKSALDDNRIVCYFQPVLNNKTKEIYKYECLARLIGDDGHVYPPFFIDISKRARLYHRITQAIISDACKMFQHTHYKFSVNLSIDDILNPQTIDYIIAEVEKYGVANRIFFEILETDGIDNYEIVGEFIKRIKKLGCQIAIDDFGSGYSNFMHILRLDIDIIKIDASIIKHAHTDRNSQIIAETIVDFSKKLGIKTIAEFVHNKEVLECVQNFGVDYSQGYYIGEPKRALITQYTEK